MSWEEVALVDVCEVGRGSSPRPINDTAYFEGGDIPWIKIADATASGKYIYKTKEYVNSYGASFSRHLPSNSLILATSGVSLGQVKFLGVKGCIHDGWLYLKDYNGIDKEFLYYKLISLQDYFHANSYGAAIQNINTDILRRTKVNLPPLQTQKRIADILSTYDDLIENNLKRIKLLEQAAQNIYKEWFVNLRFPGYENIPINEETGLPEGWEKKMFNDVSENNNRKRIPVNGTDRSKRQGNYRYYGATGVMDYIDDYIFYGRFLLVAEDGTVYDKVGNAYTQLVEGKFWVNNHAHIISAGSLPVEYLYLAMKYYPIGHLITGAVQLKLSMKNLKRVEVINPSEEILEKFMSAVNPMINQVFKLNKQNQKLKAARDILLPRLMNRTIEV